MIFSMIVLTFFILFFVIGFLLRSQKILLVVLALVYAFGFRTFVCQAFRIPSGAMVHTLEVGDHILSNKYVYWFADPERGDVIIFPFPKDPSKDYIKRVVGVGGDTLEIKDKVVYINNNPIEEPYAHHRDPKMLQSIYSPRDNVGPFTILEGQLFVMGDNRDESYDSRFWGFVEADSVRARAERIYWSWDGQLEAVRWERLWKAIK